MECQIVPNYKHVCLHDGKIKKQRKGDNSQQQSKKNNKTLSDRNDENEVYILQPMFKPPISTKDVYTSKSEDDDITLAVKAISETNKDSDRSGQFNHFTMSRKGVVKVNTVSRVEDPFYPGSPHSMAENRHPSKKVNIVGPSERSYSAKSSARRTSCVDSPEKLQTRERARRASAGDVLIQNNLEARNSVRSSHSARHQTPNLNNNNNQDCSRIVSIGPDEVLLIPPSRRPSEPVSSAKRRESNGKLLPQGDNPPLPRRKSFHDWCSIQEWYLQEPRPVTSDADPNTRRNVISPCTLSRMVPNRGEEGPRSTSISVCTEGDRMSYNFNLPSRRLVSHKDLKNCSLPYNDNIGLEEAVSSDQARKLSIKSNKQTIAIKKKYETDRQTPKQVWYRTVRSILAANHLYHSVKRKNNNKNINR